MTPDVPDHWMLQALADLRTDMRDQHRRLREDMNKGFDSLWDEMRGQNDRISDHSDRLTQIETERRMEARQALKHSTLAGALTAAGLTVVVDVGKWFMGK